MRPKGGGSRIKTEKTSKQCKLHLHLSRAADSSAIKVKVKNR